MDRKTKVARSGTDKPTNGDEKIKETALNKLRQMEWKRNKQDPWHLARSGPRGVDGVHEKKKYNKDEDIYFEGTSGQKNRKNRKQSEGASQSSPRTVPPGFNMISGTSGPPPVPVNAWAQKKGSALFSKPDEVDEEDEMLKLVLEESLKTAEEDQKRVLERIKMSNIEVVQQMKKTSPAEKGWEDTNDYSASSSVAFTKVVSIPQPKPTDRSKARKKEMRSPVNSNIRSEREWEDEDGECSASSPEQPTQPSQKELHFVDTDSFEDSGPVDHRRSQRHRSKKTSTSGIHNRSSPEVPRTYNQVSPPPQNNFQQKSKNSRQTHESHSASPTPKYNDFEEPLPIRKYSPPVTTGIATSNVSYGNSMPSYEINQNTIVPEKDHNILSGRGLSTGVSSNLTFGDTQGLLQKIQSDYTYQTPSVADNYLLDTSAYQLKSGSENPKTSLRSSLSDSIDETDIMLHNFIRRDPPTENNTHHLPPDATDIAKPVVNGFPNSNPFVLHNDDSSSSVSDSSVQNASPYGSYEKQMTYELPGMHPQNNQYPYVFPTAQNLPMPSNLVSPMGYSGVPPGYAASRGIIPPQMPVMPQYFQPNSNIIMPPTLDQQAQLLTMMHYQNLIAGMQKDQNFTPQPQMMPVQPPVMPMQPPVMPMQPPVVPNQTQPMNIPYDPVKQEINASETLPSRKSKEEIMMDYNRTLETLNKLQLELASQVQTPASNPPPLPVYAGYPTPTGHPMMDLYGRVPVMPQPSPASPCQLSPNTQQQQHRFPAAPNPDHPSVEPPVGRGRGRLV